MTGAIMTGAIMTGAIMTGAALFLRLEACKAGLGRARA